MEKKERMREGAGREGEGENRERRRACARDRRSAARVLLITHPVTRSEGVQFALRCALGGAATTKTTSAPRAPARFNQSN